MAKKTKAPHAAELADRAMIANAVRFNVHLRISPTAKINEEAATLADAAVIFDRIKAERNNRAPMVYAITAEGTSVFVPADMIDAARAAAQAEPAADEASAEITEAEVPEFLKKDRPRVTDMGGSLEGLPEPAPKKERAKKESAPKPVGKRAAALEAAQRGEMPVAPDFSAETHKNFRKKLATIVEAAEAGDIEALKAIQINPVSSSPKAMLKYRDLCITALEARAAKKDAA